MDKEFIVVIPARLESSRLEKKLLKEINGKSIIERTWNKCLESQAKEVVVATDSTEIYDLIISLGGGGFDNKEIRDLLLKNTNVIWLNTPVDLLIQRVGDGSKRPMIKGKTRDSILQLLKKRTKYYSLCHNEINTDKLNQNQVTRKLINLISHKRNKATK